jgi:hypothetical protein
MAYTVDHFYKKVLETSDKMGSDFFSLEYVMNRLETATFDFIGETVKFIENTQEIRDDLLPLYKPFLLPLIENVTEPGSYLMALPSDYLHLMTARGIDANVDVRKTTIIRHGQDEIYLHDPDTKPTAEYPLLLAHDTYLKLYSPGAPTSIRGYYIKKPTFGDYSVHDNIETEIAVNLPDASTEKILKQIVNDIFIAVGDPRAQMQYTNKETYRKRSK